MDALHIAQGWGGGRVPRQSVGKGGVAQSIDNGTQTRRGFGMCAAGLMAQKLVTIDNGQAIHSHRTNDYWDPSSPKI
ncbi:MAG: hypothetical protein OHK0012_00340 [Synechococcales cyanobacterium]